MLAAPRLSYPPQHRRREPDFPVWRRRRRLGHKLAMGLTPAQAARAERLPEAEVTALLAEPAFHDLIEAYRELASLPAAEAKARLLALARFLLMEALLAGDCRAANFLLFHDARGRDGAELLVEGAVRTARSTPRAEPPAAPPPTPAAPPRPPEDAGERHFRAIGTRLRSELVQEYAAQRAALAEDEPTPTAEPAAQFTTAGQRPSGRERKRQKWLARQVRRGHRPAPKGQGP